MRFLYFLAGVSLGTVCLIYTFKIVKIFGHMAWAEKYLGSGGTYLAWKLIGLICIGAGFWALKG